MKKKASTTGRLPVLAAAVVAAAALTGCAGPRHGHGHDHGHGHGPGYGYGSGTGGGMRNMPSAMATLAPASGSAVRGMVMFHDMGGHTMVHARLSGLKPDAEHGFHVHEKGDCSAPDATSAGGHFNPTNVPHGPQEGTRHVGDLPNLKADASGNVDQRLVVHGLRVGATEADIVGKAVVVHAQPDDYRSQPAGNSGARISCGVIARQP